MSQQQPQFQTAAQFDQPQLEPQQVSGQQAGTQGMTGQMGGQRMEGHQMGGQSMGGQQMGAQMPGRLSSQQRGAMTSVTQAIEVCEWCADQCIQEADPNMIECIRLCEDVAELGETVLALAPRNSYFTQPLVQTFQQALQACAQECGRHQHAHCQECAQVLSQVSQATQQLAQPPVQQGMR
jgi:hypothetical protein